MEKNQIELIASGHEFIQMIVEMNQRLLNLEAKILKLKTENADDGNPLGISQAAKFLNLSKARVYVLSSQGKLPSYKVGNKVLFYKQELDKFVRSEGKYKRQQTAIG